MNPLRTYGSRDAPITLILEPGELEKDAQKRLMRAAMADVGVKPQDCYVVFAYPTPPEIVTVSDKQMGNWVDEHRQTLLRTLAQSRSHIAVSFGKWATRAAAGKSVAITKVRGQGWVYPGIRMPVMPCFSPSHTLYRPEVMDIFCTDLFLLKRLRNAEWNFKKLMAGQMKRDYQWCTDLGPLLKLRPKLISVDTETTGLAWYKPDVRVLTVQIAYKPGHALVVPVDPEFWPEMSAPQRRKLISQLKRLLEDPAIEKTGHNIGYDHHMLQKPPLSITVANWGRDTQILAFNADDNMLDKSQDECVRRWVPAMAGYNDENNREIDKSDMLHVPRKRFLSYAGGDADAALRLRLVLEDIVAEDPRQKRVMELIQMPGLRAFANDMEVHGVNIDTAELEALAVDLEAEHQRLYDELIAEVPASIKRRHADKGLKFTRADFVRDILFSKDGFNLKPLLFTKSTARLPDDQKIPSTDAKNHLAYFDDVPWVAMYTEFQKIQKMRSTYVGDEWSDTADGPTGFWKYLYNGLIHPNFSLSNTVTGRSASRNPNGQNIPKRGKLAEAYRRVFKARKGYTLIECDLSQAELRIAAWMAHETTMISLYAKGADIHAATAAAVMGISLDKFMKLPKEERDLKRFHAKAVGFGFLYGMGWKKFRAYARTEYGIKYSEKEARRLRDVFFETYPGLEAWHREMQEFVREHGYVRALHGALRRLPSVYSSVEGVQFSAERQAVNSPVQRFASDLGVIALNRIVRDADPNIIRPILFVHDALIFEVRNDKVQEAAAAIKYYMETPPLEAMFGLKSPVPIIADVSIGKNLAKRRMEPDAKTGLRANPQGMEEQKDIKAKRPAWHNKAADMRYPPLPKAKQRQQVSR